MNEEAPALKRNKLLKQILLALVFSSFLTTVVIHWSFDSGRLSQDAGFDDVTYLTDGLQRLQLLYDKGVGPYLADWVIHPAHSPLTSLFVTISMVIFGVHDWSPYILNGLILAFLLIHVLREGERLHLCWSVIASIFVLSFPFSSYLIHELRPDLSCAILTGIGSYSILIGTDDGEKRRQLLAGGVLFTLALLSKPTIFPHTFSLFGACIILRLSRNYLECIDTECAFLTRINAREILPIVSPVLLIGGPLLAFSMKEAVAYFFYHTLGAQGGLWEIQGGLIESATFFLTKAYNMLMGVHGIAPFIIIITALVLTAYKRDKTEGWNLFSLLFLSLLSFSIFVGGRVGMDFFGAFYIIFLILTFVRSLYYIADFSYSFPRLKWVFAFIAIGLLFLNVSVHRLDGLWEHNPRGNRNLVSKGNSVNEQIISRLASDPITSRSSDLRVFVTFAGLVNEWTLVWLAMKRELRVKFFDHLLLKDYSLYKKSIEESPLILYASDNTVGIYKWLPSWEIRHEIGEILQGPEYRLMEQFQSPGPGAFKLYLNRKLIEQRHGMFGQFDNWTGFLPFEGPYPQWNLGIVRWGLWPKSSVDAHLVGEKEAVLGISVRSPVDQAMIVSINGETIGEMEIPAGDSFSSFDLSMGLRKGEINLVFQYRTTPNRDTDGFMRAALFRRLELITE